MVWGMVTVVGVTAAVVWSTALTVTDLRYGRLPDVLTVPAAALAAATAAITGCPAALAGAAGWWLLCVAPGRLSRRLRIGGGDAKLALSLGAVVTGIGGLTGWWLAVAVAPVLTLLLALAPGYRGRPTVPHGPGMLMASWLAVLFTM